MATACQDVSQACPWFCLKARSDFALELMQVISQQQQWGNIVIFLLHSGTYEDRVVCKLIRGSAPPKPGSQVWFGSGVVTRNQEIFRRRRIYEAISERPRECEAQMLDVAPLKHGLVNGGDGAASSEMTSKLSINGTVIRN